MRLPRAPATCLLLIAAAIAHPARGQEARGAPDERVVTLAHPAPYALQAAGFTLARPAHVALDAVGLDAFWRSRSGWFRHHADADVPAVYAWVLDASTRLPVWTMARDAMRHVPDTKALLEVSAGLTLPAGSWEVYLFAGEGWQGHLDEPAVEGGRSPERGWWESLFEAPSPPTQADIDAELPRCHVTLTLDAPPASRYEVTGALEGALIRFNRVTALQLRQQTFRLDHPVTLRLYGIAERVGGPWGAADYAWIVDVDTLERVWDSSDIGLPHAGGDRRNRKIDHPVRLGPGRYTLFYGSDSAHSFDRFVAAPPWDPFNYGVTLLPVAGFDPAAFHLEGPPAPGPPRIEFARVRNGESHEQAFRLERPGTIRVTALGEIAGDRRYDHAWILDAGSGDPVWEMKDSNTRPAGGADKNRLFDGFVHLEAGTYVLHYAADMSHAWGEWNAALPFTPDAWGVTIRAARSTRPGDLLLLDDPYAGQKVIVRIDRVGNDAAIRRRFTLAGRTPLDIYAIGEGTGGRMHDYGWIEDVASRGTVWRMDYGMTDHAGGADKNRVVRDRIVLEAGTYEACYTTDGSHAFDAWNAAAPRDPSSWGLILRQARE